MLLHLIRCLHLSNMDTTKFSLLASMRSYINDVRPLPDASTLKEDVLGLAGLIPEYDSMLHEQAAKVDRAVSDFNDISNHIASMKKEIDEQYGTMLLHLSKHKRYDEFLAISRNVREHWVLYQSVLDHVLLESSMIKDRWKYPAVCINAQHSELIDAMLAYELLYLVDTDRDILEKQHEVFDDGGNLRLKQHPIASFAELDFNSETLPIPRGLKFGVPLGQMAMVVAPNIFERFPAETVKIVLDQIKPLLRPGGKIVFNVFDAESPSVAQLMHEGLASGVTQGQIANIAQELGLEVRGWKRALANDFVVVVLGLPGELKSIKVKSSTGFRKRS